MAPPLSSELMGKWEWIKTVTPSQTITPESVGYSRTFQHENDGSDYIAFYQNDSLYLRMVESRDFYKEDLAQLSVIKQYGSKFIKYYLSRNPGSDIREMQTSELLNSYENSVDTVRHYYRYSYR
ncbi:MAG: hypothetical protein ABIN80_00020 [Dyadobacter sp.]|uniref:hypothetical protein n=1 Tax=Dyadobacter sp. TaxID=1914288 RepID=UPI003265B1A7